MFRKTILPALGLIFAMLANGPVFAAKTTPPILVATPTVADITADSATLGGEITDQGSDPITARGIEWDTVSGGTGGVYANSITEGGTTIDAFTVATGSVLPANPTTIYFRAWAENAGNGQNIGYSDERSFTTLAAGGPPTLNSSTLSSLAAVTSSAATLGGQITNTGGGNITERGIVWNTTSPPESGGTTVQIPGTDLNPFAQSISGLTDTGKLFYFRSYAINDNPDTGYGPVNSFYTEPNNNPTNANITFTNLGDTGFTINWPANPAGDGDGAIVVINTSAPAFTPTDGVEHTASTAWANAGDQVVYRGTGVTSVPVTGLSPSTTYNVAVFYSSGSGTGETGINYRQTSPATNSQLTNTPAVAPTVSVAAPTNPTSNSAVLGGNVTDNGGASVTERGIVWNTTNVWNTGQPPASNGTVASMGSGDGPFSQTVNGLPSATTIYVRAYAINSAGTAYSSATEQFDTPAGLATVATRAVENLTATTADLGGNVTDNGGAAVTERGIVWNTTNVWDDQQPPANNGTAVPMGSGLGLFIETVGDDEAALPTGTLVYFKAYAINSAGTAYSGVQQFTPAGPPVVTSTQANVIHNAADLGGNVSGDGGSPVIDRGIVWNTDGVWDTGQPPASNGTVVSMGSGLGSFSQFVTGFSNATLIYFRAYATNSLETGYSAQDTFTTLSEPTLQATLVNFTRISGKSLKFEWTRGNGDGSIVLMREGAAVDPDPLYGPVDTNDSYLDNPDFSAAQDLGSTSGPGNKVVYHGPNNRLWVTGLSLGTTYHVAVYEYAGSGSKIDYIQSIPAENNATTSTIPVHNYDNRVDCNDCHNQHGTFDFLDGTSMKAACTSCHNDSSPYAPNKVMFDNHLTPSRNTGIDEVSCGMCHELHLDAVTKNNTQGTNPTTSQTQINKSFLRTDVDKYVPNAATPAFLHTDQPKREELNPNGDPVQPAVTPERALEGDDPNTGKGYCQVCHTMTAYHRNNPSTGASTPADHGKNGFMQCHDGSTENVACAEEVHCGDCHEHSNKFVGVNNNLPCEECHNSVQGSVPPITPQFDTANVLSSHIPNGTPTQPDCIVCHGQHTHDGSVYGVDADDGVTQWGTAAANTLATGAGEVFTPHCLSCHDSNGAASLPDSGSDQTRLSPFISAAAPPTIGDWANAGHNRPTAGNPTGSFGANPVSCIGDGTNGCHASGHGTESNFLLAAWNSGVGDPATNAAESPAQFCFNCHDSNGPSSNDIEADFPAGITPNTVDCDPDPNDGTVTGTGFPCNWQVASGSSALVNQRHDILSEDQTYSGSSVSCASCHEPHADNTANPVVDVDSGNALPSYNPANYSASGDVDASFGVAQPDYIQFCLACHDGSPPSGVTFGPDGPMVNISGAYSANDHHGAIQGGGSGNGFLKPPYDGSDNVTYSSMNCTDCHGAHGSPNIFNLKSQITIGGTVMTVGGWAGDSVGEVVGDGPPGAEQTIYYLPRIDGRNTNDASGTQQDHYWGAWCSFCHQHESHGKDETVGCTSGHMHGGGKM